MSEEKMSIQDAKKKLAEMKSELENVGHDVTGYLTYQISRFEEAITAFERDT